MGTGESVATHNATKKPRRKRAKKSEQNPVQVPAGEAWRYQPSAKKVAIIGKAPSWPLAPYDDDTWEIWTLSDGALRFSNDKRVPHFRWSRHFEVHNVEESFKGWPADFSQWVCTDHGKPCYMAHPHPAVPHGIQFPWRECMGAYITV